MRILGGAALVALLAAIGGCGANRLERAGAVTGTVLDWRRVATPADRVRIREWRTAFSEAIGQARASGHAADVAAEGALLDPDAGRGGPPPPAGDYRCRVVKLGSKGPGGLGYVAYPSFACRIEQEGRLASFRKLTGSQRPVGVILDGGTAGKPIFLGTLMLGDEKTVLDYGRDPDRDLAGAFEQLAARRWRLLLPYPRFESVMDVIELVPAG
jgi:hypothetical protein